MLKRFVSPASDPLPGFLSLSAVSWQTRASRPCFVPQPFLGSPFRAFPSSRSLTPLGAAWLPCSHPPACRNACLDSFRPWFHRRPRRARPPGSPNDYELPFLGPKSGSWLPWVSSHGIVSSRQLHLLRSVSPSSSPFATRTGFPTQAGRCSLGFSSPLESSPSKPRSLVPARARRLEHACLPVGSRSLPTGSEPSRPGEVSPLPRKLGSTCSTGFSPLRDWPAPPLGGAPPLMTLIRRPQPSCLAYRVS